VCRRENLGEGEGNKDGSEKEGIPAVTGVVVRTLINKNTCVTARKPPPGNAQPCITSSEEGGS
jgi:hypothetical protein